MHIRQFFVFLLLLFVLVQLIHAGKKNKDGGINKEEKEVKDKSSKKDSKNKDEEIDTEEKEVKDKSSKKGNKKDSQNKDGEIDTEEKEVKDKSSKKDSKNKDEEIDTEEKEVKDKSSKKGDKKESKNKDEEIDTEEKEVKDKSSKKEGNKESKKDSKTDKKDKGIETPVVGTSMVNGDTEYWSSERATRVWSENDASLNNQEMLDINDEIEAYMSVYDFILPGEDGSLDMIGEIFKIQEKFVDLGVPVAYLFGDNPIQANNGLFPISTLLGALVDTKNGQEVPPILSTGCSLENCMDTTYQWVVDEEEKLRHEDLATHPMPSIIENLQENFLTTLTQLSRTFSKHDTQEIMCEKESVEGARLTVAAELRNMDKETSDFMKEPGVYSQQLAERRLIKTHDRVRGQMLLKLAEGLCGETLNTF